jgi:dTMP kinase
MAQKTPNGRLVAICGIDGSGKATQTALLAKRAAAEGWTVEQVSFPRYGEGFFGELIQRYLRGEFAERASDVNPYLAALPYACDRWETSGLLHRRLAEGRLVLCNRYVPANQAHQGSKLAAGDQRRAFVEWVDRLEYGVFGLPRPDLHLLLDLPPALSVGLVEGRNALLGPSRARDIHESDLRHLQDAAAVYRDLAAGDPGRWALIACAESGSVLPPDRIARSVWARVRPVLYTER